MHFSYPIYTRTWYYRIIHMPIAKSFLFSVIFTVAQNLKESVIGNSASRVCLKTWIKP